LESANLRLRDKMSALCALEARSVEVMKTLPPHLEAPCCTWKTRLAHASRTPQLRAKERMVRVEDAAERLTGLEIRAEGDGVVD
jgi:hypothetical protein